MTVSLLFGSSPNAGELFNRGCLLPMISAVDLCEVFDSVNRNALSRILSLRGVPLKLTNLIAELCAGTEMAVRCGHSISD